MIVPALLLALSLTAGVPSRGSLAAGESAVVPFTVPPQTVARITVTQEGIDIVARLRAPAAEKAFDSSNMSTGTRGQEVLLAPLGDVETEWELTLEPSLPHPQAGHS